MSSGLSPEIEIRRKLSLTNLETQRKKHISSRLRSKKILKKLSSLSTIMTFGKYESKKKGDKDQSKDF